MHIAKFLEAEALASFDDAAIRAVSKDLGTEALLLARQTPLRRQQIRIDADG